MLGTSPVSSGKTTMKLWRLAKPSGTRRKLARNVNYFWTGENQTMDGSKWILMGRRREARVGGGWGCASLRWWSLDKLFCGTPRHLYRACSWAVGDCLRAEYGLVWGLPAGAHRSWFRWWFWAWSRRVLRLLTPCRPGHSLSRLPYPWLDRKV